MRTGVPFNENRFFPVRIDLQGLGLQRVICLFDKAEQIHKMITVFTQNDNFFHLEPF